MICIYEASSAIEAHMIKNLLQQFEIKARIHGEYLQGGVGELQAGGIVRVMVDDENAVQAQEFVNNWDEQQLESNSEKIKPGKKSMAWGSLIIGFALGAISLAVYYNVPETFDGVDHDNDGFLDEKWTFRHNRIVKSEIDRNLDGKIDLIHVFNRKGNIDKSLSDEDFDSSFETTFLYENGNPSSQKSDFDGDGFEEYQLKLSHGAILTAKFMNPKTRSLVKIQYFELGKLVRAELDSNKNGVIDTVLIYDEYEEIVSSTAK